MELRRFVFALLMALPLSRAFAQDAPTNPDKIRFSAYVLADVFYSFNITNYTKGQQGAGNLGYFQPFDDSISVGVAELGISATQGPGKAHISLVYGTAPALLSLPSTNLWEAYVSYQASDWELKAGYLAPFLGFEVLETTENLNQSRSLFYTYCLPRNNLGFSAKVSPSDEFSASFYIWAKADNPPPHHGKTFGLRLQANPQPDVTLTLGGQVGPTNSMGGNADPFAVIRGEFTALWRVEDILSFVLSADYLSSDPLGLGRSEVMAMALYGRYEFEPDWLVALRLEEFLDLNLATLLYLPSATTPLPVDNQEGREATLTLEHKLTKNLRTRLEGRLDWALGDGQTYTVGPFAGGETTQITITWGAALGF